MVEFRGDDGAAHHHDCRVKRFPDIRHVDALAFRNSVHINADDAIGASGEFVEGQRIGGAAID